MRWGIAVVEGLSMVPSLSPGERVLVRYESPVAVDDVVLVQRPDQIDIKRVKRINGWDVFVEGDNIHVSIDSRHYGPIHTKNVIAKVMWRLPRFTRKRRTIAG